MKDSIMKTFMGAGWFNFGFYLNMIAVDDWFNLAALHELIKILSGLMGLVWMYYKIREYVKKDKGTLPKGEE